MMRLMRVEKIWVSCCWAGEMDVFVGLSLFDDYVSCASYSNDASASADIVILLLRPQ